MEVSLIDYTGKGTQDPMWYAARILAIAKGTRLDMSTESVERWGHASHHQLMAELKYSARTIPSSWEFVHYTFLITGVSRACTHQMVRTRTASYAQQSMRTVNMRSAKVLCTIPHDNPAVGVYEKAVTAANAAYSELIDRGIKPEDARGILPTNVLTNIIVGINLRNFCDLVRKRNTSRTQGEYRDVVELMTHAVHQVHPWAELFTQSKALKELAALESHINQVAFPTDEQRTDLLKSIDIVRSEIGA